MPPKRPRTKCCLVKDCENFRGNRDNIRMFKIPNDHNLAIQWKQTVGLDQNCISNGFICINHFSQEDFNAPLPSKPISLKKGAIPSIFPHSHYVEVAETAESVEVIEIVEAGGAGGAGEAGEAGEAGGVEGFQVSNISNEMKCSKCDCTPNKIERDLEVVKLQDKIKRLQSKLTERTEKSQLLNKKVHELAKGLELSQENLEKEKAVHKQTLNALEKVEENELLKCIVYGHKHKEIYSPNVRKFCITLNYHSPKAYNFVRETFENCLPTTRTLAMWYANSNTTGEPGLLDSTFERLKGIVSDLNGKPLICSLIFDEMYIRKQVLFCSRNKKYIGYTTYGRNSEENKPAIATQAIVFMLSGINMYFQFVLGYHFINSLSSEQKVNLVLDVLKRTNECGIHIENLTFDGLRSNIGICNMLGANLDIFSENFNPSFENPFDKSRIHIIMDASHMLKLIRNTLAEKKILYDDRNEKIAWHYFEELGQSSIVSFIGTHKLRKKHMQWYRNKMNVRVAAETLSDSVADTMEYLMNEKHPKFINAGPTIRFTRYVNKTFDIFNSTKTNETNIHKRAINCTNKRVVFSFLEECVNYLKHLKIETKSRKKKNTTTKLVPIVSSLKRTSFNGFIINVESLNKIYTELIEEKAIINFIPTYAFSQDALEMHFGKIRGMNGRNTNPDVIQFKGAYRKLQCNLNIRGPEHSNCRVFDSSWSNWTNDFNHCDVFFVSSYRPKLDVMNDENFQSALLNQNDGISEDLANLVNLENNDYLTDLLAGSSLAYAARLIEEKIEKTTQFYCNHCKFIFSENEKVNSCYMSSRSLYPPCASTYKICQTTDKFLTLLQPNVRMYDFNVLYCEIFQEIDFERVYEKSDFNEHEDHKYYLVKCIVNEYVRLKVKHVARQLTLNEHIDMLRSKLTKTIHFLGQ